MPVINPQLLTDSLIVAMNRDLTTERNGDHQQGDPSTVRELGSQNDQEDRARHHEADDVDGARAQHTHAFLTRLARTQLPVPVLNHAQLREREGDEDAHDVQLMSRVVSAWNPTISAMAASVRTTMPLE